MLTVGIVAGAVNTIVGSGSLVTFPTLVALGYPPVVANVSNTVGIWPGSISGAWGYRRELAGQARRCLWLGICSGAGAVLGGVALLQLPVGVFGRIVPVLILLACALMALQPVLTRRLAGMHSANRQMLAAIGVFLTGIYGGYFGAAQGVILIALLGVTLEDTLQRLNAAKNVLAASANLVAAILFVCVTHVAWLPATLIAAGSVVGGQLGAVIGRRTSPLVLRIVIVCLGTVVAVLLLVRGI